MATRTLKTQPHDPDAVACAAGEICPPPNPTHADIPEKGPRSTRSMGCATTAEAHRAPGGGPQLTPSGAKRRYGMVPPGSALVEAGGVVNLANADMHWARIEGRACIAIDAQSHRIGLLPATGQHAPGTAVLKHHTLNTSAVIAREVRAIGVDPAKAAHTHVGVVRVRHRNHGTRYLVLCFPPESLKARAVKHKTQSPKSSRS